MGLRPIVNKTVIERSPLFMGSVTWKLVIEFRVSTLTSSKEMLGPIPLYIEVNCINYMRSSAVHRISFQKVCNFFLLVCCPVEISERVSRALESNVGARFMKWPF